MSIQNQGKIILIVDDNERNMKLAVDLLELAGFRTIKASSGGAALEILKTERPDLILLDMGLPGFSGDEVYAQIRKNPDLSSSKIVAFTASVMNHEKERILKDGFDAFIAKPIDTRNFVIEIRSLLAKSDKEASKHGKQ
jgi:two-component system, cell cycle response regulator DivK